MVSRAMRSTAARVSLACVVISPATTTRSVVTRVSQATRLLGSASRQKSRTASLIWSATLSGWPMETDSLVNRYRSEFTGCPHLVVWRLSRTSGGRTRPAARVAQLAGEIVLGSDYRTSGTGGKGNRRRAAGARNPAAAGGRTKKLE